MPPVSADVIAFGDVAAVTPGLSCTCAKLICDSIAGSAGVSADAEAVHFIRCRADEPVVHRRR